MKNLFICLSLNMLGVVMGLVVGRRMPMELPAHEEVVRIDTVVRVDTVMKRVPVMKDSVVLRYVTRYLPAKISHKPDTTAEEVVSDAGGDMLAMNGEDLNGDDDAVAVSVPISQRIYDEAEYTAWVSGYEARLDSIELHRDQLTVQREVRILPKQRKWGCVAGAGIGVGMHGVTPMIGVTVGYRIL